MGFRAWEPLWTMGGLLSVVMVTAAPVQASELSAWSYREAAQLLEFSLPQSVLPRFFLLADPTRIVLDIPATQLGAVATEATYAGVVERIRVSQFEGDTVRMVIDLAPGTVLQERQAEIEFDDGLNGQRRWQFRPRIDVAATEAAAAIATAPMMTPPPPLDTVTATVSSDAPIPEPPSRSATPLPTPLAESPVSLENAEEISYSAVGLQLSSPVTGVEALPVDLYAEASRAETAETVTVPPLASSAPAVAQPTSPPPGYVPPMVAPELETVAIPDPEQLASESTPEPALLQGTSPSPAASLPMVDPMLPNDQANDQATSEPRSETLSSSDLAPEVGLPEALTNAVVTNAFVGAVDQDVQDASVVSSSLPIETVSEGEAATVTMAAEVAGESTGEVSGDLVPGSNELGTSDVLSAAPVETVSAPGTVPPFIDPEPSVAAEATQYTAAIVPLEPLSVEPSSVEPSLEPSGQVAAGNDATMPVVPIPVVDMGRTARTITQTAAPTVVQFGQPLPGN